MSVQKWHVLGSTGSSRSKEGTCRCNCCMLLGQKPGWCCAPACWHLHVGVFLCLTEGSLFHPAALQEQGSSLSSAFVKEQQPIRNPTGLQGAESHSHTCGSAAGDGGMCHGLVLNASFEIRAPVRADHNGSWALRLRSQPQHRGAAAASPLMSLLCATANSRRQGVQASSRELFTKDGCDPWGSLMGNEKRQ